MAACLGPVLCGYAILLTEKTPDSLVSDLKKGSLNSSLLH